MTDPGSLAYESQHRLVYPCDARGGLTPAALMIGNKLRRRNNQGILHAVVHIVDRQVLPMTVVMTRRVALLRSLHMSYC